MSADQAWTFLRTQNVEEGLRIMQQAFPTKLSPSQIMELGVAYMWAERYPAAKNHFQRAIKQCHGTVSSFYGMAGAAMWCLGEFDEAVETWRLGLIAEFADTAGLGVHLPLLLWFASRVKRTSFEETEAIRLIRGKCDDSRIEVWPGPIARFIVREIDERELRNHSRCDSQSETQDRNWLCDFYIAILLEENMGSAAFQNALLKISDTTGPEWSDQDVFLSRMWSEEFFLARCGKGPLLS
jgi:hypothetical protein